MRSTVLTVEIPLVAIDASGNEVLSGSVQVLEEVVPTGETEGPFSLTAASVPEWQRGLVALRINYPYQAAALANYPSSGAYPPDPNIGREVVAGPDVDSRFGPNAGSDGLGRLAGMGQEIRPFRKVLTGQTFARRELFR